jgi:glycosyltransferase involved in cell wall biosynthesis
MKRLLWIVGTQFDVAIQKTVWLEMIANLRTSYEIRMVTGYRHKKVYPSPVGENILYYNSLKIPVANRLTSYIFQLYSFYSLLKSFRPIWVMIGCRNPLLLRYATLMKGKYKIKLIYVVLSLPVDKGMRGYIDGILLRLSLQYAARRFEGITYITDELRRYCVSTYNLPSHPSTIWTSGVNVQFFYPSHTTHDCIPFKILYHGAIGKERRLDNVIRALPLLKDIDVCLEFLADGNLVADLKALAKGLDVSERVTFHQRVNFQDVPRWINRGHAGILPFPSWPGWNTSSPIKLFEYLACGKPVIVTDIPAHQNVLKGCEFAFWAEKSSPEALANAIRRAYNKREQLENLGKSARKFVTNEYTWEKQAKKLADFLERV